MEESKRSHIYNRLCDITLKIDRSNIPNPQQINQLIGECHSYLEEVEHYQIEIYKELSIITQAQNNAEDDYNIKKENLLLRDDIRGLPSITDREAKASSLLRSEQATIKNYGNELNHLNNLLKALNGKYRNLTRINSDIKSLMRVMEAQLKLNGPIAGRDIAHQSLLEEFKKSMVIEDSFEDAQARITEQNIVDPTTSINIDDVLAPEPDQTEPIPESLIEPNYLLRESASQPSVTEVETIQNSESLDLVAEPEKEPEENFGLLEQFLTEPWEGLSAEEIKKAEQEINTEELTVDLDKVIEFEPQNIPPPAVPAPTPEPQPAEEPKPTQTVEPEGVKSGGNPTQSDLKQKVKQTDATQKEGRQEKEIGIDIDDLLSSMNL
jgi:hypothetical protein